MKGYFNYIIIGLLLLMSGCSKGPYRWVQVESYLVKDNYLYMLIFSVDGIDDSSRFADNSHAVVKRQRLIFARLFLGGATNKFEVLATHDQAKEHFQNEVTFMLVSSNAAFVETRSGRVDLIQFGTNGFSDIPTGFCTGDQIGDRFYNFDHSVIFSKPNGMSPRPKQIWAVATFSLADRTDSLLGIPQFLDTNIASTANFAVTPDCSKAIIQMRDANSPTNFLICDRANSYKQRKINIPFLSYTTLEGAFTTTNGLFMVMESYDDPTNILHSTKSMIVCNERGVEVARTRMEDTFFFDKDGDRIINIPAEEENRLGSISELNIRIWSPFTGSNRIVKADTAALNRAFTAR